jgi:hypothetical protein
MAQKYLKSPKKDLLISNYYQNNFPHDVALGSDLMSPLSFHLPSYPLPSSQTIPEPLEIPLSQKSSNKMPDIHNNADSLNKTPLENL